MKISYNLFLQKLLETFVWIFWNLLKNMTNICILVESWEKVGFVKTT